MPLQEFEDCKSHERQGLSGSWRCSGGSGSGSGSGIWVK